MIASFSSLWPMMKANSILAEFQGDFITFIPQRDN